MCRRFCVYPQPQPPILSPPPPLPVPPRPVPPRPAPKYPPHPPRPQLLVGRKGGGRALSHSGEAGGEDGGGMTKTGFAFPTPSFLTRRYLCPDTGHTYTVFAPDSAPVLPHLALTPLPPRSAPAIPATRSYPIAMAAWGRRGEGGREARKEGTATPYREGEGRQGFGRTTPPPSFIPPPRSLPSTKPIPLPTAVPTHSTPPPYPIPRPPTSPGSHCNESSGGGRG